MKEDAEFAKAEQDKKDKKKMIFKKNNKRSPGRKK